MRVVPALAALVLAMPAAAQHDHAAPAPSPYGDLADRRIKALADEDIARLLNGEGMGFALAAELNHFPGPRHALELADHLELTADQRTAIEAIRGRMAGRARTLGADLVAAEAALDRAFAAGTITAADLDEHTRRIGALTGALRYAHLAAHLEVTALLRAEQVERYDAMRGYDAGR